MSYEITRRFQFCAGHRVYGHESKCANLHGHNYIALVTCTAPDLDGLGRVVDFSEIKAQVGQWIDTFWDHGMILFEDDPMRHLYAVAGAAFGQKHYIMKSNPTAENMARELSEKAQELFADGDIIITRVRLFETENCYADWS